MMYAGIIQDQRLWVGPVQPYLICDFVNQMHTMPHEADQKWHAKKTQP
jgi:hypothetical protein